MAPSLSADPAPEPSEGSGRILRLARDGESEIPTRDSVARAVRLYHFPTSLCSQKVRLVLAEKGVAWQSTIVNIGPAHEQLRPWYAKLNPRLVVPTLAIDDTVVTNSRHIVETLEQQFPGPTLIPDDLRDQVMDWVELQDQLPMRELELAQAKGLVRWLKRWSIKQKRKRLRKLTKQSPELTEIYRHKLDDLDKLDQAIGRPNATRELVDEIEAVLEGLERHLADKPWLAGDRYTLADAVWTPVIARLEHVGFARTMAAHRSPNLAAWYARLRERPSWNAMIRRLTVGQALRYYGPAVLKTFLLVWVLKWTIVIGLGWVLANL
jgi:glutathione S-transferase